MSSLVTDHFQLFNNFVKSNPRCKNEVKSSKKLYFKCDGRFILIQNTYVNRYALRCVKCGQTPRLEDVGMRPEAISKENRPYFEKHFELVKMTREEYDKFRVDTMQVTSKAHQEKNLDETNENQRLVAEEQNRRMVKRNALYRAYLSTPIWKVKRDLVLKRDNNKCQACLINLASEVHHKNYNNIFNEPLFDLVSVCSDCHRTIRHESGGMQAHVDDTIRTENIILAAIYKLRGIRTFVNINNLICDLQSYDEFSELSLEDMRSLINQACNSLSHIVQLAGENILLKKS